jgi:hypothetical protein
VVEGSEEGFVDGIDRWYSGERRVWGRRGR